MTLIRSKNFAVVSLAAIGLSLGAGCATTNDMDSLRGELAETRALAERAASEAERAAAKAEMAAAAAQAAADQAEASSRKSEQVFRQSLKK